MTHTPEEYVAQEEWDLDRHGDNDPPWYLSNPETGEPWGTNDGTYLRFASEQEAIEAARAILRAVEEG